jgi:hypothetical protein
MWSSIVSACLVLHVRECVLPELRTPRLARQYTPDARKVDLVGDSRQPLPSQGFALKRLCDFRLSTNRSTLKVRGGRRPDEAAGRP